MVNMRGLCIEPLFDPHQTTLWSCDRRSYMAAWYASLKLGFIGWHDFSARHFVRAVQSAGDSERETRAAYRID